MNPALPDLHAAPPQPLARIRPLAEKVLASILTVSARADIAGSIRRQRDHCGDIDIVCLPRPGADFTRVLMDLAGSDGKIILNGQIQKRVLLRKSRVQVDIWCAHPGTPPDLLSASLPSNYGALLLTYTGSVAHNIRLSRLALDKGWQWKAQTGLIIPAADATAPPEIVSLSERDIYARLGLPYLEPTSRDAFGAGA